MFWSPTTYNGGLCWSLTCRRSVLARSANPMAKQIRVGSVDLFQGQQAAVAITSLGSSSGIGGRLLFVLDPKRTNVALLGEFWARKVEQIYILVLCVNMYMYNIYIYIYTYTHILYIYIFISARVCSAWELSCVMIKYVEPFWPEVNTVDAKVVPSQGLVDHGW